MKEPSKRKVIPTKAGRVHLGTKERSVPTAEAKVLVTLGLAKYPVEKLPPQTYMTREMVATPRRAYVRRTPTEPKPE